MKKYLRHLATCNTMQDWTEAQQALADTPERFRDDGYYQAIAEMETKMKTCTCGLNDALEAYGNTRFNEALDKAAESLNDVADRTTMDLDQTACELPDAEYDYIQEDAAKQSILSLKIPTS